MRDQLPDFGIRPGGDGAGVQNRHLAGRDVLCLLEARIEQLLLDGSPVRLARAATEIEKLKCGHGQNTILAASDTPHPQFARLEVSEAESSRRGRGPPLLKTLPTIDRPPLSRLKGYGRLFPTLGARGSGFDPMVVLPPQCLTSLYLARLATFGFILKSLVGKEKLLTGGENELRAAVHTLHHPIPVLHSGTPLIEQGPTRYELRSGQTQRGLCRSHSYAASRSLILFVSNLLACPFASQGCLDSLFLTRFQIERMSFDFLYDVLLLDLALEAAKRVF